MRSRPPANGVCVVCNQHVGQRGLVWDHCHICGAERGWTCNACNTAMTEHMFTHMDRMTEYLLDHSAACHAPLMLDVDSCSVNRTQQDSGSSSTKRCYIGNGANDGRFIMVSNIPGHVTVEQMAAIQGVTAGTARDQFFPRHKAKVKRSRTLLITQADAIQHLAKRWNQ